LGDWAGHLLVNDFSDYKTLFSSTRSLHRAGLLGTLTEKVFDLHNANGSPIALAALTRISKLYDIEQQSKKLDSDV